jgi:hypothetical protein
MPVSLANLAGEDAVRRDLGKCAEQRIGRTEASQTAGRDRSRHHRVHHGSRRRDDGDRTEIALVVRWIPADQMAHAGVNRRFGKRQRRIDRPFDLRGTASEVRDEAIARNGDRHRDRYIAGIDAIIVDPVGKAVDAVGHRLDRVACEPLSLIEQRLDTGGEPLPAIGLHQMQEPLFAGGAGCELRAHIAQHLTRHPDVAVDYVEHRFDRLPGVV